MFKSKYKKKFSHLKGKTNIFLFIPKIFSKKWQEYVVAQLNTICEGILLKDGIF